MWTWTKTLNFGRQPALFNGASMETIISGFSEVLPIGLARPDGVVIFMLRASAVQKV
jgi:hypothetical protein